MAESLEQLQYEKYFQSHACILKNVTARDNAIGNFVTKSALYQKDSRGVKKKPNRFPHVNIGLVMVR